MSAKKHNHLRLTLAGLLACSALAAQISWAQSSARAQSPNQKSEIIAPGIEHTQITRGHKSDNENTGPWVINLLRIDLSKARLQMVHALDEAVGLETTSSLAARYGALAAVNSGYFRTTGTYRGDSVGVGVLDGKILSETNNSRAAVGLIENARAQEVIFGHLNFAGRIISGSATHAVNGVNRPRAADELIVFTPEFHRTTLTNRDGVEIVIRNGRVTQRRDLQGSTVIPSDGFVISAAGSAREWALKALRINVPVRLQLSLSAVAAEDAAAWQAARNIVGGGPQLIRRGRVEITNEAEKILPAFIADRHPRTAIGKTKTGEILLVTVDGRQAESVGMSLTMLAELLLEFGAVEAINFDGGGSTTMVIKNKVVNKPSDASGERPVSDAILIYGRPGAVASPK